MADTRILSLILSVTVFLCCCKPNQQASDIQSLEELAGYGDVPICHNPAAPDPKEFHKFFSDSVSHKRQAAFTEVLSLLPHQIQEAARSGALQLTQQCPTEGLAKLPGGIQPRPGCFAVKQKQAFLGGLLEEQSIRQNGARLIVLAFLNLSDREVRDSGVPAQVRRATADLAQAFLWDIAQLAKDKNALKTRKERLEQVISQSPALFANVIAADAVESIACGGMERTRRNFPLTVAAYFGREPAGLGLLLDQGSRQGFLLQDAVESKPQGDTHGGPFAEDGLFPSRSPDDMAAAQKRVEYLNSKTSASAYPNMAIGPLYDPRERIKADPEENERWALAQGWPVAVASQFRNAAEQQNKVIDSLNRADQMQANYEAQTRQLDGHRDRLQEEVATKGTAARKLCYGPRMAVCCDVTG